MFWTIDSRKRLVHLVAEAGVTREDVAAYLEAVIGAKATAYRKLFDGRDGTYSLSPEELVSAGAAFRSHHDRVLGPIAIVLTAEQSQQLARFLGILASARRPMRLFTSRLAAKRWTETFA